MPLEQKSEFTKIFIFFPFRAIIFSLEPAGLLRIRRDALEYKAFFVMLPISPSKKTLNVSILLIPILLGLIPEFNLPGFGSKTKHECNTVTYADYCPDCHEVDPKYYHCNNWNCPDCLHWTATRAAKRIAERIIGSHAALCDTGTYPGHVNHFTFSPPAWVYDNFDLDKMKKLVIKYAKQVGISGGAIAFHPYRIKGNLKKPIRRAMKAMGLEGGEWDGVHANVLGLESWRDYAYFSPHFHIVVTSSLKSSLTSLSGVLVGFIRISQCLNVTMQRMKKESVAYSRMC